MNKSRTNNYKNLFKRGFVIDKVAQEVISQDDKWGDQSGHSLEFWLAIEMEELGEVAEAILGLRYAEKEGDEVHIAFRRKQVANELIQVATVAVNWLIQSPDLLHEKSSQDV